MGFFGGDSVVGLDIGTSSIKAVKIAMGKGGWEIAAAAQAPTPRGALVDGTVSDPKMLLPAIREVVTHPPIRGSAVIAAINYTAAVTVRRVPLPVMSQDALRKQIKTQPDQLGLSAGQDYVADFDILGIQGEGEGVQMDTVLVSAPRAPIATRMELLERAGLDVLAMDLEPFALMRTLSEAKTTASTQSAATAILDLGAVHTDVTVVRGPHYIFTRAIPFGGDGFTEVIRQALKCPVEEAESLKTSVDLGWLLQGVGERGATPEFQATVAVKSVLDDLLKEVRNSVLFYQSQLPEEDVEGMVGTIMLTGGTALMKGLAEYMQAAFGLHVACADLTQDFGYPISARNGNLTAATSPRYTLAMGLAVKGAVDRARQTVVAAAPKSKRARGKKQEEAAAPASGAGS